MDESTNESASFVVCSFCQEEVDRSLFDSSDAVQSCPQCSSVLSEEQVFNYDLPASASQCINEGSSSYHLYQNLPRHGRPRTISYQYSQTQNRLRKLAMRSCEKLQLSKEITDQIVEFLVYEVNKHEPFRLMKNKINLVGACIYVICRNNDITITFQQIAVATDSTVHKIGSVAKQINVMFGLQRSPVKVQSLITTACSHLSNPKECEELAQGLCRRTQESLVLNGTALPQAIAHSVLASLAVNKGVNQRGEISKLCLKMSQVAEKTVLCCIRTLKGYMLTLLKEIPWINTHYLKMTNVQHYIKDIMKYEQNGGKFSVETANPRWLHRQKKELMTREKKINSAMERIRTKQCPTTSGEENPSPPPGMSLNEEVGSNSPVASAEVLDEEDRVIEELLELGCSPLQVQEGFYDNLKTTSSSIDHEIAESEIESYMRNPEEVVKLKRVMEKEDEMESEPVAKRNKGSKKSAK